MAKGRRSYNRDARGRFASGGGIRRGEKKASGGTAPARAKLRAAKTKLSEAPSPQRRGAVTRARKALRAAKVPVRMAVGRSKPLARIAKGGRRRGGRGVVAPGPANNIRPAGLKAPAGKAARNNIRRVGLGSVGRGFRGDRKRSRQEKQAYAGRLLRVQQNYGKARQAEKTAKGAAKKKAARSMQVAAAALAQYSRPRTAIKPYRPPTLGGRLRQIDRQMDREMKGMADAARQLGDAVSRSKSTLNAVQREIQRMNAKAIAGRLSPRRIEREIAGIELGIIGGRSGAKAIQRRMERAAAAAARGSKPAARARVIYGNQLAFMGAGKPVKGSNNLRPGPRNSSPPPKKKRQRKPRKPKG